MAKSEFFQFLNPINIGTHLYKHRHLIKQLVWREFVFKYKGSFFGVAWAILHPLIMLLVFTYVFSFILKAKWGITGQGSHVEYALLMFVGMLTFDLLGQTMSAAPSLILANSNYVKKVVFPLEVLPVIKQLSALLQAMMGLGILLIGIVAVIHKIYWTIVFLPLIWLQVMLFSMGIGYFLASIGVFVRDLEAIIGVMVTFLYFLSPIFYSMDKIPERFLSLYRVNPMVTYVVDARRVLIWGKMPDWPWFGLGFAISVIVFTLGFIWFMKSKNAFADVI